MERNLAVLDACVLYPASLRDVLLETAVQGLFHPRWTNDIHEEWMSHVLADRPDLHPRALARTRRLMETAFPDALVEGHHRHIAPLTLPDAKDRHVVAAAMEAGAATIVTFNLKDFPRSVLAPLNIKALHPDDFFAGHFAVSSQDVCHAIRRLRGRLKNPPMDVATYLELLSRQRLTKFAALLKSLQQNI